MAVATIAGSTVVFSNSGAAANLTNSTLTEDNLGEITFDVLAASGGGTKTTLYSVDDGTNSTFVPVNNGMTGYNTDLLSKDSIGVKETTANGGKFWIGADGKIHYDASGLTTDINSIAVGSSFTDSFQYTIKMSNGTLSVGTLSVKITNTNDGPQVTSADLIGGVTEDASLHADDPNTVAVENGAFLTDAGTITFDDADLLDTHTVSVTADAGNTQGGTLKASVTDTAAGAGDGTVTWVYSNDNANVQHLGAGDTAVEKFTVTISDGHGGTVDQVVEVTIHGVNDDASITGDSGGSVTEDGTLTASGTLVVHDVDDGEAHTVAVAASAHNSDSHLGSYSVDADGNWNYTVDNALIQHLGNGIHASDSFDVTSADGTATQTVTIDIVGVNDTASITGDSGGSVTEDGTLTASGTLVVHDVDDGEAHTVAVAASAHNSDSHLGSYSVDADGNWNYTVDNALIQHLGDGIHASDSFDVTSADGTATQTVTIDIVGVNDAADITDAAGGDFSVTEDSDVNAGGTLLVSDVDDNESAFDAAFTTAGTAGANGHGTFTFDATTGEWTYLLNNNDPAVQALNDGDAPLTDSYTVQSLDGTSHTITVNIGGADEAPAGGNTTVGHDGSTNIDFTLEAAQHGEGPTEAHTTVHLDALPGGFNFSGTIDLTVTGDFDASQEHIFIKFENGVQVNAAGTGPNGNKDVGDPDSVSHDYADVTFSSADSTLDVAYHTSSSVDGTVQITGVASYHYETPV